MCRYNNPTIIMVHYIKSLAQTKAANLSKWGKNVPFKSGINSNWEDQMLQPLSSEYIYFSPGLK